MKSSSLASVVFALAAGCATNVGFSNDRTLLDQLTVSGVRLTDHETARLPPPGIESSMDATSKQKVLSKIAGGIGWKRFSRDSVVAPIEIDLEYVRDDGGQRIGHRVYVAFVAHIEIDRLRDRDRMSELLGWTDQETGADRYHGEEVSEQQLRAWNIEDDDQKYALLQIPLLDRVLVHAVIASQHRDSENDVNVSWMVDPKFGAANASRPCNRWSRLDTDESASHPYQGAAGYIHVTKLDEPANTCLIEASMVIHEPPEWFSGSNLLRSKLPLMIQEIVRKFRRRIND